MNQRVETSPAHMPSQLKSQNRRLNPKTAASVWLPKANIQSDQALYKPALHPAYRERIVDSTTANATVGSKTESPAKSPVPLSFIT
jgi:hypothetical protein